MKIVITYVLEWMVAAKIREKSTKEEEEVVDEGEETRRNILNRANSLKMVCRKFVTFVLM